MTTAAKSPCLLTIAGVDPSSGAGISADMAVFSAHRCFGISAVTALTVQSTRGVRRIQATDPGLLAETLECVHEDLPPDGIKIGMLADRPQVEVVAHYLQKTKESGGEVHVVLDPVLHSSSGAELLTCAGRASMIEHLLPHVDVITPNLSELALLTDLPCGSERQIQDAMSELAACHAGLAVLATGGDQPSPDDRLLHNGAYTLLRGTHVSTKATHGTGCAFSSSLLCGLVLGGTLETAATDAKRYVETAMRLAEPRGSGKGPMQLLWPLLPHDAR